MLAFKPPGLKGVTQFLVFFFIILTLDNTKQQFSSLFTWNCSLNKDVKTMKRMKNDVDFVWGWIGEYLYHQEAK